MYLELPVRGYAVTLDPNQVPEPLKRFFESGLLTEEHVRIYREYNGRDADNLFMEKYAEIQANRAVNLVITEAMLKSIVAYEAWAQVMPSYSHDGELVVLMVAGYVRAYLKSGVYVEISEVAYKDKDGNTDHGYDVDIGRV